MKQQHSREELGEPLYVSNQKEWFEDLLGDFACCGPAKVGMTATDPFALAQGQTGKGTRRRGFKAVSTGLKNDNHAQQSSGDGGDQDLNNRSTIGELTSPDSTWEFDDAYPDTWPDAVDIENLSYAYQQDLVLNTAHLSLQTMSAASTPTAYIQVCPRGCFSMHQTSSAPCHIAKFMQ